MEDERITLETAKLLKKTKFDLMVHGCYTEYLKTHKSDNPSFRMKKGEIEFDAAWIINHKGGDLSNENYINYAAPTQSLLQKWLREKFNIQVYAHSNTIGEIRGEFPKYKDYVGYVNGMSVNDARDEEYQTYEEALEFALQKALTMLP